ncbi:class D beta-lactamase [Caedibacter taeniospiralis]|uniref:class D beta-lactamase n=1 Tax=Caedibacter taeniospiralis TaxID=28907 RepID=UPI000C2732B5|nr:class D beta-lactamase [Caedibacter taeniospiralis]
MKKFLLFLCMLIASCTHAQQCFMVKEEGNLIYQKGDCNQRYSPCSTFKIALSLIGYDSNILVDETHPRWSFEKGYSDFLPQWRQDQTPESWMKYSCVWYSQVLTQKLGMKKLQSYVTQFNYGNEDLSGDKGKNNGLTRAWLSSSLEISSVEQIAFLEKLSKGKLPTSQYAHEMTRRILFVENLPNGWKLYGKTGNGALLSADKTKKLEIQHGWFIGWIEKAGRVIVFSDHISDDKKKKCFASLRAKEDAKKRLLSIISSMDVK